MKGGSILVLLTLECDMLNKVEYRKVQNVSYFDSNLLLLIV